jgi:dipeptide/tripeptide permease
LLGGYAATVFLGAALLFLVQPMVSKMLLPHLGGSPAVWNTCMVFFQATLLLGYFYAHWLARRFGGGVQAAIHCAMLGAVALFLPFDLTLPVPPTDGSPVPWLLGTLALTVGPPFFAISATAPLLQRWFSRTSHPAASDPYFLYAASNAGSLIALLAYPLAVEPHLRLFDQSRWWAFGLGALVGGIALCWYGYARDRNAAHPAAAEEAGTAPTIGQRARWVGYAFVPSAYLLAVTAHITIDLASAPLFWVIPLALYLLTFIFGFARRPPLPHWLMVRAQPFLKLAKDGRFFHFLAGCGNPPIVLGDARLTLQDVPDAGYDVILMDAFGSDSVPIHLLTREALALCQRKLAAGGVILFHVSNRYLELAP